MVRLIVAAGGEGDAVAGAMLDAALYGGERPAVILTYAWDRPRLGPVPGPRGADDFTGLRPLTPRVFALPAGAETVPPAVSTLPRLARALPQTLALIDPRHGARGVARQIDELVRLLAPESIDLLNVGGGVLARGGESGLRLPLAGALALAACGRAGARVRLLIAGPGLDGELPAGELRGLLGRNVLTLAAEHVQPVADVLEWHPDEAAAMLAACARDVRGLCEAREAGPPVPLTDEGPTVHEVPLPDALGRSRLARALASTTTLAEAEQLCRDICGCSEIDRERGRALRLSDRPGRGLDPDTALARVAAYEHLARGRGISHTTFRRLGDALGLSGAAHEDLRALLIAARPEQCEPPPLWHIPAAA
ncbi:DUF1152 domain-containing protein [Streptomyces sp. NPDC020141]|uniref:DUF1152 domain-containing protein n=1 Tax=Streptomyces sp. NPDC020141 TaxID=3365065 RepID=UPI0037AEB3C6